jgi:hypothetical protein
MLRRTTLAQGGHGGKRYTGVPLEWVHPKGVLKRTFPMREARKHPAFAPNPGGLFATKYVVNMPLVPFEMNFYRIPIFTAFSWIILDLLFGLPIPFMREQVPGTSKHFWGGNNQGLPHHFWCYQDGWYVPNESGAKRMVE